MLTRRKFLVATAAVAASSIIPSVPIVEAQKYGNLSIIMDKYPKQYMNLLRDIVAATRNIADFAIWDFNDDVMRSRVSYEYNGVLYELLQARELYSFLTVCNRTNNTPDVIDRNALRARIYVKPWILHQDLDFDIEIGNSGYIKASTLVAA